MGLREKNQNGKMWVCCFAFQDFSVSLQKLVKAI